MRVLLKELQRDRSRIQIGLRVTTVNRLRRDWWKLSGDVLWSVVGALLAQNFVPTAVAAAGHVIAWGSGPAVPAGLTTVNSMAAGYDHAIALKSDGRVAAWGVSVYGLASAPADLNDVISVAAGYYHNLALRRDGKVVAWGAGQTDSGSFPNYGQCIVPAGLTNVVAIAAAEHHSLALKRDGSTMAWGLAGSVPSYITNVVAIAAGSAHDLALRADGTAVAWGNNAYGQTNVPPDLTNVIAIAAGGFHNLALKTDHTVVAWGANSRYWPNYGQAVVPNGLSNVVAIAAGKLHSLALKGDGTVAAWGQSFPSGQGLSPYGLAKVVAVAAGDRQSFAINDGSPALWFLPGDQTAYTGERVGFGSLDSGLGTPPLNYQWHHEGTNLPAATNSFLGLENVQLSDAGSYRLIISNPYGSVISPNATLIISESPPVILKQPESQTVVVGWDVLLSVGCSGSRPLSYQWRINGTAIPGATDSSLILPDVRTTAAGDYDVVISNAFGSLASSSVTLTVLPSSVVVWGDNAYAQRRVPSGTTNLLAIAANSFHNLALKSDGTLVAWGASPYYGSDNSQTNIPAAASNVIAIAVGSVHSLALRADGAVIAWGSGSGTNLPSSLSEVVAVAAGYDHSLALRADGTVLAWGTGSGTNTPAALSSVVAVAAGWDYSLALKSDGILIDWGSYFFGGQSPVPPGLSNVIAIAVGYSHSLALKDDGTVAAWGASYHNPEPVVPPAGLSDVVAVAAGGHYFGDHSLALRSDGSVVAWGANDAGQTNTPVGLSNVLAIAAGARHSLALVGTNPPVIRASISNLTGKGDRWFSVSIPTASGRVYRLEYKNSLAENNWIALPLVAGTGGDLVLTDPAATGSQRFYQVRQW